MFDWMGEALDLWYTPFSLFIDPIVGAFGGIEAVEDLEIPFLNDLFDADFVIEDEETADGSVMIVVLLVTVGLLAAFLAGVFI